MSRSPAPGNPRPWFRRSDSGARKEGVLRDAPQPAVLSDGGQHPLLLRPGGALAQKGKGPWGGWGPGTRYAAIYNPQTAETLRGEVQQVERFTGGKGMSTGVRLLVKTDRETVPVLLGPSWYLEKQAFQLTIGDQVEISGAWGWAWGRRAFIAREVKKGGQVLRLRDARGVPLWTGQGWRQRR